MAQGSDAFTMMARLKAAWIGLGPNRHTIAAGALILLGVVPRALLLNAWTSDTQLFVMPWFDRLADAGYKALGQPLANKIGADANYTPPYYYLLYFASLFDGVAPRLWLIKFVSIAFDIVAAVFARTPDEAILERAVRLEALADAWRLPLRERLAKRKR